MRFTAKKSCLAKQEAPTAVAMKRRRKLGLATPGRWRRREKKNWPLREQPSLLPGPSRNTSSPWTNIATQLKIQPMRCPTGLQPLQAAFRHVELTAALQLLVQQGHRHGRKGLRHLWQVYGARRKQQPQGLQQQNYTGRSPSRLRRSLGIVGSSLSKTAAMRCHLTSPALVVMR